MKRSEINSAIQWAADLMKSHHISLPVYADWSPAEWKEHEAETGLIRQLMLGWDITDYGRGDFDKIGTVLYTVRNGSDTDPDAGVPYCEKYLIMKEGQRLLNHYHVSKTEDIITPGNSISLTPYMAHIFGAKAGCGPLICGEVSKVNNDLTDNYFLETSLRFPEIEEDEPALHPMCNEYTK